MTHLQFDSKKLLTLLAICMLVLAGCGSDDSSSSAEDTDSDTPATESSTTETDSDEPLDLDKGRDLFQKTCRSCHALADADAAGTMGPSLDTLSPDSEAVRRMIKDGGGGMPPNLLDGSDADIVSDYVAEVAGKE